MEKRDARLFQQEPATADLNWNIVELESRRHLRRMVNKLIALAFQSNLTTTEISQLLLQGVADFGPPFATQLVRSLQRDNQAERQTIVWLLTLLNASETVTPLRHLACNPRQPRTIRLSASLALAGMGETAEMQTSYTQKRLYAIS